MDTIKSYFIRPQRQTYHRSDLGPSIYFQNGVKVQRTDFTIINDMGNQLQASFFQNAIDKTCENCVIYLHTHHGSRLEGIPLVNKIIQDGSNICLFDFGGYGLSQGTTVTMGSLEKYDIGCIIKQLKKRKQKRFVLWGRSMGAVTALLFNQTFPYQIVASVYDSPFNSLQKLTLQLAERSLGLPQIIIKPAIELLKLSLLCQLNFGQLQLQSRVSQINIPGYFIASKNDSFLNSSHSQTLYSLYRGSKQLLYIDQDHNESRKQTDLQDVFVFIRSMFCKSQHRSILSCNNLYQSNILNIKPIQLKQRCKTSYCLNKPPVRTKRMYEL